MTSTPNTEAPDHLPCPFCGSCDIKMHSKMKPEPFAECRGCAAHGPIHKLTAWNTRADLTGWRDIENVPKDGTEILVFANGDVTTAWFCDETGLWPHDEMLSEDGEPCNVGLPSHWMPLPTPPEAKP